MRSIITRWALASIAVSLCALVAVSTLLTSADHLLVGSASAPDPSLPEAGGEIPDAVPSPEMLEVTAEEPRVSLVFDDGIGDLDDEKLEVLERNKVAVTAFVYGQDIPDRASKLKKFDAAGHEVGLSLFNRSGPGELQPSERIRQYQLTQRYVHAVVGKRPVVIRLPGTQTAASITALELHAAEQLAADNFVPVFADIEIETADDVAADETSQLVTAQRELIIRVGGGIDGDDLANLIQLLRNNDYRFETVSDYGQLDKPVETGGFSRLQSQLLLLTALIKANVTSIVVALASGFGLFLIIRYLVALAMVIRKPKPTAPKLDGTDEAVPGVSVLIPAHNAGGELRATLTALSATDYPGTVEILVIDDGSSDNTAAIARSVDGVRVFSQRTAGSIAALNEGVRRASHDLCVFVDSDSILSPKALTGLVEPFLVSTVGAVVGSRLGATDTFWARLNTIDAVTRSAVLARPEARFGLTTEVTEGVCAVRRSAIVDIGGLASVTTAHYTDLAMSLGLRGWDIGHARDAEAVSATKSSLGLVGLWQQHLDRSYGLLQAAWKHGFKGRGHNTRYRFVALAYRFGLDVVIPLVVPVIDVVLLVAVVRGDFVWAGVIWYVPIVLRVFASWIAVLKSSVGDRNMALVIPQFLIFRYLAAVVAARSLCLVVDGRDRNRLRQRSATPQQVGCPASSGPRPVVGISRERHG